MLEYEQRWKKKNFVEWETRIQTNTMNEVQFRVESLAAMQNQAVQVGTGSNGKD